METKKLELIFLSEDDNKFTLAVDEPRSDLDAAEVEAAMNTIIENNIFSLAGGDIKKIENARIVTRQVENII